MTAEQLAADYRDDPHHAYPTRAWCPASEYTDLEVAGTLQALQPWWDEMVKGLDPTRSPTSSPRGPGSSRRATIRSR